ncbi:hypothetical protein ACFX1Q_038704 [Malus domestica]
MEYKSLVENSLCTNIITLRSDSGREYLSNHFSQFLAAHGIHHQLTYPHTLEQNGCAERKHRHLVETARTLLTTSKVPHIYWVEAFTTAIYLINRLPTASRQSPWESLYHRAPNYELLKVFGCACFPWLKPYSSSKLDPKGRACVFLGYSLNHKGYKCLDPATHRVYISRHVLFNESSFPFHHFSPITPSASSLPPGPTSPIPSTLTFTFPISSSSSPTTTLPRSPSTSPSIFSHNNSPPIHSSPMQTRSKSGIFKPKALTTTKHLLPSHLSVDYIPKTYLQASKYPHWCQAMQEEVIALIKTGTWSLVPQSLSQNIVGCKWVFHIKRKPDGTINRYKARLVAKGFNQQEGLDYTETSVR